MNYPISEYKKRLSLSDDAEFIRIVHKDALVAIVYKITQPNAPPLILKICERPQDYFRELYFLKHFSGVLPIARVINVIEPGSVIHGAILMECFPGSLLQASDLTEELAYKIGVTLAQIHLNRTSAYGDLTEPHNLNADPRVYFTLKFDEGLLECQSNLPKELLQRCRQYYDAHVDLLLAVDGPCIIHRDFRPGNIMVNDLKLQGVIDWASGRTGFAEDDFCPWELGEWGTNPAYKNAFLIGYVSIRPVPNYASIMPFLRLNRAIATIGFTVKQGTWDNSSSGLYKINREFLTNFFANKMEQ
jgi:Ser/Thr protein kinase RdoA (MazF antagonist)